jgi:hypothetical protein
MLLQKQDCGLHNIYIETTGKLPGSHFSPFLPPRMASIPRHPYLQDTTKICVMFKSSSNTLPLATPNRQHRILQLIQEEMDSCNEAQEKLHIEFYRSERLETELKEREQRLKTWESAYNSLLEENKRLKAAIWKINVSHDSKKSLI